jgi:hypothetical protein
MIALSEIGAQCQAHGGLTHVWLLDPAEVSAQAIAWISAWQGSIIASQSAQPVRFTEGSAAYRAVASTSDTGRTYLSEVSFTVSKGQISVDGLVRRLQDKTVHAFFRDRSGTTRVLWHARVKADFEIGAALGGRQQYNVTLSLTDAQPARTYTGTLP